ncbi:MAG: hypothetical protein DRN35_04695 [Thermoplasmata archaeon]|nr:MAG: hypothetical protein DRN28_05830 [Thermoplasmata archaeon]RLF70197.1 MAG: hypothetical protein DRN35_04695 [Thermoplasmata archaeon]RLF72641.1 MAG: hypothetical protein DRN55_05845 [Thermoplasmata archaeon]
MRDTDIIPAMSEKSRRVKCPSCGRVIQLKNLTKHYRAHHPDERVPSPRELLKSSSPRGEPVRAPFPWGVAGAVVMATLITASLLWWYVFREEGLQPEEVGFFTEDGMYIFAYLLIQDTTHPTVILLHDMNQDHHAFDDHLEFFYSKGYNVCTLDLRGFGKSVWKRGERITLQDVADHEYANYTKDVGGLIRYLKNNYQISQRFTIIGAGLGASVGALYSIHNTKVKSVILISPQMEIMNLGLYRFTEEYGSRPIMVITSTQNPSAYSTAESIYNTAKDGKEKLYVDEAISSTHLLDLKEVREGVSTFLNQTLPV